MIHGGNVWIYGGPSKVLDFSSNTNPLGPPKLLADALMEAIEGNIFSYYPEPTYTSLKESLSRFLNVDCRLIEVFNGASEALFQLAYMFNPLSFVLTPPSFIEYWRIACSLNRRIYEVKYLDMGDNYILDIDGIVKALSRVSNGLVYICNPNNPTGTLTVRKGIEEIVLEASRRGSQVIVDESFMDFTMENQSVIELVENYENLHVVKSLTKIFASPGLRLGLVVSSRIEDMGRFMAPWRVNILTSYAFSKFLQDLSYVNNYIDRSRRVIFEEVSRLIPILKDLRTNPYNTSVNFILVKLSLRVDSTALTETLALRYGILIRDASTIPGLNKSYIRISVRRSSDNLKLMKALGEALSV